MASESYFNQNYHIFQKESNPNRLFASFSIFKTIKGVNIFNYDERPPYPILNSKPHFWEVVNNMNKSDFVLYFSTLALGKKFFYRSMNRL